MKNRTRVLVLLSIVLCMLTYSVPVYASTTAQLSSNQQVSNGQIASLISAIPQYLAQQQYDRLVSETAGDLKSSLSSLLLGSDCEQNKTNNIGFWDVNSCNILKYKQVPNNQVPSDFVHY
jgi:ABC-type glycerol-3-phosphate transport system permease component